MWDTVSVNGPRGPQKAPDQRNSKKEIKSKLYVWSSSVSNYKHQCNCVFLRQSQALKYSQSVVTLGKLPLKSQTVCACVPTGIQPPTNGDKIHCKSWRCCNFCITMVNFCWDFPDTSRSFIGRDIIRMLWPSQLSGWRGLILILKKLKVHRSSSPDTLSRHFMNFHDSLNVQITFL